jgi:hypothetical protein
VLVYTVSQGSVCSLTRTWAEHHGSGNMCGQRGGDQRPGSLQRCPSIASPPGGSHLLKFPEPPTKIVPPTGS